jgi:hypothetical protein
MSPKSSHVGTTRRQNVLGHKNILGTKCTRDKTCSRTKCPAVSVCDNVLAFFRQDIFNALHVESARICKNPENK